MGKRVPFYLTILAVLACGNLRAQSSGMWVTGYYPVWSLGTTNGGNTNAMYPDQANWNGITHVVHFGVGPDQSAPYWHPDVTNNFGGPSSDSLNMFYAYDWRGNSSYSMVDSLRKYIHLAGAKLLLSCGGIWGAQATAMDYITSDSSRTQVFVNAVVGFVSRHGYDGVEIDYEPPQSQAAMSLLTRIMKRKLTAALGPNAPLVMTCANLAEGNYDVALKDSVSQYLFMMYDMHNPYNGIGSPGGPYDVTGFNAPLHLSGPEYPILNTATLNYDGTRPVAPDQFWGPNKFASMGFPKSKIGVGIPFYGYAFDTKDAPNQSASGVYAHYLNYVDAQQFRNSGGGTYHYDNTSRVPWLGGTATQNIGWVITSGHQTYVTYDDTNSVKEKVQWAKTNGFGGMMMYELWTGWMASAPAGQRDPLLRALVNAVNNPPLILPTGTFSVSPTSLPAGGGTVTLTWSSSNAQSAMIDQGIGAVALSGSRSVAVTATTTFTLTLTNGSGSQTYPATVTVAAPPPPAPVLGTPANGATGVATNPTFTWNASSGATSYHVQASTSSSFSTTVIDQSNITSTSYTGNGLAASTTYYWHVSATNSGGTSVYSTAWSFTTAAPPPPPGSPVLASPANGASGVATNPTVSWYASSGATSYRVQVSTSSTFSTTVIDQSNITSISFVASGLYSSTTYYWHVSASNAGGSSTFSTVWSFTTVSTPTGLVAAYAFDEGSGTTVADASGHGLTGTASGTTWSTQGRYADALSFDGVTSYVDLGNPSLLQFTGSMTLSAWVKASANPADDGQIVAKSDNATGWQLKTSPDTGPQTFGIAISSGSTHVQRYSTTVRSLNVWYHVAGVYNAAAQTLDIYVNGVLDDGVLTGTVPSSQTNSSYNVNIGQRSGGFNFAGLVDDVRLYNRPLSQAEIQADMNTPLGGQVLPPPPQCLAPANWATGQPTSLTFRWNRVASASGYHLQVSGDSLFASPLINDAQVIDTARQVTNLAQGVGYYWRVSSRSTAGEGSYSSVWSFRTATGIPPTPVLLSPADAASNEPVVIPLSWRGCSGATSYTVQVATDSLFGSMVVNDSTVVDSTRQVSALANQTRYFWRVRSKNAGGGSNFSSSWRFTTAGAVPSVPVLLSPANGSTGLSTSLTLTWNASPGATSYRVQVSTTSAFTTTIVDQSGDTASSLAVSGLAANTTYYWHVSATNGGGTSSYSTTFSFATASLRGGGLVASYAFNEGTGQTVADASGNGLTGTIYGATWTTAGRYGDALSFNGTSNYIDLKNPVPLALTGSMTLTAWVYATMNPPDDGQIIAKSTGTGGWQLKSSPDTGPHTFAVAVSPNSSAHVQRYSRTVRALNTWYHVAGVYNASARTLDIYVNGILDDGKLDGAVPASQYNAAVNVNIGRRSGGFYFAGRIDEVHVYNRALSQAEIQSDMTSPSLPPAMLGVVGTAGGDEMSAIDRDTYVPTEFSLAQNYPNPFNPSTIISFDVPEQSYVTLIVYNILGQKVATLVDGVVSAGRQEVRFSGDNLANGVYLYVLKSGSFSATKRMMMLK